MPDKEPHVSLWHPYTDKPGQRHTPNLWCEELANMSVEQLIHHVAGNQMYLLVHDILGEQQSSLLRHKDTTPYMSRTGKVVALHMKHKNKAGFMIPRNVWGCKTDKEEEVNRLPHTMNNIYKLFGYEAITPASLSEKVLRSTLPARTIISRPSDMMRRSLLEHSIGGRIDTVKELTHYETVYNYDEGKSYLDKAARGTPSPYHSPDYLLFGKHDDRWQDYAACWIKCTLTAHACSIHPIQVHDDTSGAMRSPMGGELIERWLWSDELLDCLNAGYTLEYMDRGYGWKELSNWMEEWADILWEKFQETEDPRMKDIIKTMMVGLPGRFLKSPEQYTLIHQQDGGGQQDNDIAVLANWTTDSLVSTPWFIRPERKLQSAQLTHIGSYIVMKARQKLYHMMKEEERRGNTIIRSYIDCYSTTRPTTMPEKLGTERGMYKEKINLDVYAVDNMLIPRKYQDMKAPGYEDGKERKELWRKYHVDTMEN